MGEIWKDVKGFEGLYQVSSFGRVRSFHKYRTASRILKQGESEGYKQVIL